MKIAAYGIGKNEEKNIPGWFEGIKDADYVLYVDTGSTDKSVEIAKSLGIDVKFSYFDPWDETMAKNAALSFIPLDFDYCINLDMDQHMKSKDWKEKILLENGDYEIMSFNLHSSHGLADSNVIKKSFKIHKRQGLFWFGYRPEIKKIGYNIETASAKNLDIVVSDIPGDEARFENRDPLYIKSYKNYVGKLKRSRNNGIMVQALNSLALSYYEVDDKENFENVYYEMQEFISKVEVENDVEIPDQYAVNLAYTLFNPNKTIDIYNKLYGSSEISSYQKFYLDLRKAIIYYKKKEYQRLEKILNLIDSEKTFYEGNETRWDSYALSETEINIIKYLKNIKENKNNQEYINELDNLCLIVFSSINWGKWHTDLAQKSFDYFEGLM